MVIPKEIFSDGKNALKKTEPFSKQTKWPNAA
jgi:hypothetical protein